MLLNAAKCQGYSFYRFWVIKGNPTGDAKITPSPTLIRVNIANNPKYDRYQCGIASMFYNPFDKNASSGAVTHALKVIRRI